MKNFVICLSKIETSLATALKLKSQLDNFGENTELFEGTYGTDAVQMMEDEGRTIHPVGIKGPTASVDENDRSILKMQSPGVKGCFYSHYRLWKKCVELNEPIIILEHDAIITAPWSEIFLKDSLIKLHHRFKTMRYDEDSGEWSKSAHAYCLSPDHATKLIEFSKKIGAFAVDTMIGSNVVPFAHLNKKETSLIDRQNKTSTTNNLLLYDEKNIKLDIIKNILKY
jgi:GR25 family glycosyltransferase involved in LPS biosynthesis